MDLSLWDIRPEGITAWAPHGFAYWIVSQNEQARWYWREIVTDEWDAGNRVEYECEYDRSKSDFATWEEAALNCQEHNLGRMV